MKYDRILRGGTVVDGTGAPGRQADLAMKDGRVFFPEADAEAEEILDVSGLTVCPGFIDIHSHSDICPLVPYLPESKLYQGATSELCGNCGISILPCNDERREEIENYCASELEIPMLGTKITTYSTAAYARHLEAHPMSTNYGMLVGHGTLRGAVMGFEDRPAAPEEMRRMEEILEQELLDGAFGMSLGLAYPPSCFAPPEELETLSASVGSDVPFCVRGGTALATGRGEKLESLPDMPDCEFLICKPDFSISTPELFRKLDQSSLRCHPDTAGILAALERGELEPIARR
ncbi:MAG: hypothetical protein II581_08305, partial [Oscillospiraceae bacterium]|nr:hypothetical protein [Oscillospiraceae bacterium]